MTLGLYMKQNISDLALFGGVPAFAEPLHVGRPNIGDRTRLMERINDILDNRWLTNAGPYVKQFEERVAQLAGVKHCVAMCNATVGLEIAIRALGMTGEVIVPSMTFIATAHALQWQQITPIFCDIDPDTLTLDPARVQELITPRTTGIIGVHLWGRSCDTVALETIAHKHNLRVLYDAAHMFASTHLGKRIGGFGDAEVFSFHATKFFNTFEGGAVVTDDDELAAKLRLMKNFGFAGYDNVVYVGTNGKMSEVSAAMGLTGLESLDEFIAVNYAHYQQYAEELDNVRGVRVLPYDAGERANYQYVVLDIDVAQTNISRDALLEMLWAENVRARRYFYPGCHRMEPYRSLYPMAYRWLPVTEAVVDRVLVLPTGTAVTPNDITVICNLLRLALEHPTEFEDVKERAQAAPMVLAVQ
jgi:dTDP-4-amino-4,6-dideoxygalactose transaminase